MLFAFHDHPNFVFSLYILKFCNHRFLTMLVKHFDSLDPSKLFKQLFSKEKNEDFLKRT